MKSQFSDQVRAFTIKCGIVTDQAVRKIVFDLFARVIRKTPVDTGMLRANWQIGIDSRPSGTLANTGGKQVPAVSEIKAGGHVYVVNNLPYAPTVELGLYRNFFKVPTAKVTAEGFSTQAPAGMARISVAEIVEHMNAILGGLK